MLGGTFDPPHLGHLALAAAARRALDLDCVWFVPAGDPWRKAGRELSAAADRVRMVRAAVEPLDWARVSTVEVERSGPSYSADTMEEFAREGGEWWLTLGQDALADLPHWHDPPRLIASARLALAQRSPQPAEDTQVLEAVRRAAPGIERRIDAVTMPELLISSTELRARVRRGRSTGVLIPLAVREVIDELGLYREQERTR